MALSWEPLAEDVKALVPARVAGRPFSANTTPNLDEVMTLIGDMARDLLNFSGEAVMPVELEDFARDTAAWGAAAEVERGLYPEQSATPGSNYAILRAEYLDRRARLAQIIGATNQGVPDPGTPSGVFPIPFYPLPPPNMPYGQPVTAVWPATPGKDYYQPLSTMGF